MVLESIAHSGRSSGMASRTHALLGGMMLASCLHGCARRPAHPEAPFAAAAAPDATPAAAPDAATENPCDVMRASADDSQAEGRYWEHMKDRRIEDVIGQYYQRQVVAGGIDDRSFRDHPVMFQRLGTSPGMAAAACVQFWDGTDGGMVPGRPRFAADHRYAEVLFEFADASDGEYAYTAFVDLTVLEVVAVFHYSNFQP